MLDISVKSKYQISVANFNEFSVTKTYEAAVNANWVSREEVD